MFGLSCDGSKSNFLVGTYDKSLKNISSPSKAMEHLNIAGSEKCMNIFFLFHFLSYSIYVHLQRSL